MEGFEPEGPKQQVPVERLEVTEVEDQPMPLRDRPFEKGFRSQDRKQLIAQRARLRQAFHQRFAALHDHPFGWHGSALAELWTHPQINESAGGAGIPTILRQREYYECSTGSLRPRGMTIRSRASNSHWTSKANAAAGMAPSRIRSVRRSWMPARMGSPSPPAPIRAAMVAVPTLITALVLIPAMIAGDAIGSWIRHSWARSESPSAAADSFRPFGIVDRPT